jgi:uncharacterized protein (DUF1800 family)
MARSLDMIDPQWAWQPFVGDNGEWTRSLAAHLFRRAAFGASSAEIDAAVKQRPGLVVEQLLRGVEDKTEFGRQRDELANTLLATGDARQLAAWWVYVLLQTPHPLLERMTLFWHGHFATSAEKVADAALMLDQNQLLRRNALGDFRQLVQSISRDPAMLIYLDSATNRKAHPNENFARELMELFCLGEGNYSEQDIRELARCFTGWEIKLGKFRLNQFQHDVRSKTVLGKTAEFVDGESINWILDQPQAAQFIASKLFRLFICDEPLPSPQLLEPLADELRKNDWRLPPVVQRILSSQLFFSPHAIGRKVRSPVDFAVGLLRSLEGTANTQQLAADLEQNGQGLFFPPNVKGWDGGRTWINSSSIVGRANLVARLMRNENTRFSGGSLRDYLSRRVADQPEKMIEFLTELLLAVPLPAVSHESLIEICRKSSNPTRGCAEAVQALATMPEFQLG